MTAVRGWCPSAWRPMAAGDGLLLRVRPPLARLTRAHALLVAELATRFGNGAIDLTRRGALQLRGFEPAGWRAAVERLVSAGLVDLDAAVEAVALTVAPDWHEGDDTHRIARALAARRGELPELPAKFGIAVDAGAHASLGDTPADLRVERGADGGLILRADGRESGMRLIRDEAVDAVIALARWFVTSGGGAAGRMRRHAAALPDWAMGEVPPREGVPAYEQVAPRYGRLTGAELAALSDGAEALRVTPWRSLLKETAGMIRPSDGRVSRTPARPGQEAERPSPADLPAAAIDACVGAPACPQASVTTRALADRLAAARVAGPIHVSGCAKGCARSAPAALTIVGRDGRFDLIRDGRVDSPPTIRGLTAAALLARLGAD
ncbi:cobalamin biosynthesis protein CobG [Sphingomonas sp. BK235]|uniref:cobalamin biosynthesis protein CobG n=1 Tax=Sphingomonas sp. BK235 TaxID=2512131 RepID=UPI0010DB7922|nr:cobalamin biosynthesis protein CobG [Sphingomonas sp. BK235]TCP32764.1 precorrin-3B synthase [Sphingomonas sp. BK235]